MSMGTLLVAAAFAAVTQETAAPPGAALEVTAPAAATDAALVSAPENVTAPETAEMADLMSILDEETAIATKTRMNSDYVPGIVTVLHGDELSALGATNVWEALSFVPGVEPILDPRGRPSAMVRGTYFPFNMGNVRVLVDGIPLSRETSGMNSFVLFMPVEQIERIEVIRGPGSIQYGDMAFMGLVNIITRNRGAGVFARGGSGGYATGGAHAAVERDGVRASVNVAGTRQFDAEILAGRHADAQQGSGIFSLDWGGLSLSAMLVDTIVVESMQAAVTSNTLNNGETDWAVSGGYDHHFGESFDAGARVSYLRSSLSENATQFQGDQVRSSLVFTWNGWRNQSWSTGLEYTLSRIETAEQYLPAPAAPAGLPQPAPVRLVIADENRNVVSASLQDNLTLGEDFSLIPGLRFDGFSDIGGRLTPRFAAVWRAAEHHIVKAQYSEGFRAPTFFEVYANNRTQTDLSFEINRTAELNYIFRVPNMVSRLTVFGMQIADMMYIETGGAFDNSEHGRAFGVEGEWSRQVAKLIKLSANASLVDNQDSRRAGSLQRGDAVAALVGDIGVLLTPLEYTSIGLHQVHVSERPVAAGYELLDVTAARERLFIDGLGVRAGVKNALDYSVDYVTVRPDQSGIVQAAGRTYWAGISYRQ